jgi:hypothetical protein
MNEGVDHSLLPNYVINVNLSKNLLKKCLNFAKATIAFFILMNISFFFFKLFNVKQVLHKLCNRKISEIRIRYEQFKTI